MVKLGGSCSEISKEFKIYCANSFRITFDRLSCKKAYLDKQANKMATNISCVQNNALFKRLPYHVLTFTSR